MNSLQYYHIPRPPPPNPNHTFRHLLEGCCSTRHAAALENALKAANTPELFQVAISAIPSLYRIATRQGDVKMLHTIRNWSRPAMDSLGVLDLIQIVETARPKKIAALQNLAISTAALQWWLGKIDFSRTDTSIYVVTVVLLWTIWKASPDCFCRALKRAAPRMPELLQDPDEHARLVAAIGQSNQIIELCHVFQQACTSWSGGQPLGFADLLYLMNRAVRARDLETLIYLGTRASSAGMSVASLAEALQAAIWANNFEAALYLRINQAPIRDVRKPPALTKPVGGVDEFRRRALNILFDDAWNVMQHTGDGRQRAFFLLGKQRIDEATMKVAQRLDHVKGSTSSSEADAGPNMRAGPHND